MRFSQHMLFLGTLLILLGAGISPAAVFVQQPHINAGNPATQASGVFSTQEMSHPAVPDLDRAKTWDNFSLDSFVVIDQLYWTGGYGGLTTGEFNPHPVGAPIRGEIDFQIQIFGSANNQPDLGNLIVSLALDAGLAGENDGTDVVTTLLPNQRTSKNGGVFAYGAHGFKPLQLPAGDYWLSIVALQTFPSPHPADPLNDPPSPNTWIDPSWGWQFGSHGDNQSYNFDAIFDPIEPGISLPLDLSFTLSGDLMGDANRDGIVDFLDVSALSAGIAAGSGSWSQGNFNGDGVIDFLDVSLLAGNFGAQTTLVGDANRDGIVNFLDVSALSAGIAAGTGGWELGNFNGDHVINFLDVSLLAGNLGASRPAAAPVSAFAAPVPEPATGPMLLISLLLAANFRRRQ